MGDFKDLSVWKRSRALANGIYDATEAFPPQERLALTDQLRRATVSIAANLAEGNARFAPADQGRFYRIALGSARETEALLILSLDRRFLSPAQAEDLLAASQEIQRMIVGLLRYCVRRRPRPPNPPTSP